MTLRLARERVAASLVAVVASACAASAGCGDAHRSTDFVCDERWAFDPGASVPARLVVDGRSLRDPEGAVVRLRGANLKRIDAEGARDMADMGLTFARLRISFEGENRDDDDETGLSAAFRSELDGWVESLAAEGIWILLEMRSDDATTNDPSLYDPSSGVYAHYERAWRYLACRYATADHIAGYGLLAEPSASRGDREPVDTLVRFQRALMNRITTDGDQVTPFFVGPDYNYDAMQLRYDDYYDALAQYRGRLVYEVNALTPKPWIQDGTAPAGVPPEQASYPQPEPADFAFLLEPKPDEPFELPRDQERVFSARSEEPDVFPRLLNAAYLRWHFAPAADFAARHDVPVVVDQFGASTFAAGQLAYEADLVAIVEELGFGWARWSYNAGSPDRMIVGNADVRAFYASLPR